VLSEKQKQRRFNIKEFGERIGALIAVVFGSNVITNWLQEIFDTTPTYLFCDATKEYLGDFIKFWNKKEKHWEANTTVCTPEFEEKYAADCSYLWNYEKKKLLRDVNQVNQMDSEIKRVFRWKKIASIRFNLKVDIADFLNKQ